MVMRRRSGWVALIGGSIGIGLIAVGAVVFAEQVAFWLREREWQTITLRSLLLSPWFQHSRSGWQEAVVQLLDTVPVWVFLMVVGALIAFRAGRVRR
jgi:hypothetical protein